MPDMLEWLFGKQTVSDVKGAKKSADTMVSGTAAEKKDEMTEAQKRMERRAGGKKSIEDVIDKYK